MEAERIAAEQAAREAVEQAEHAVALKAEHKAERDARDAARGKQLRRSGRGAIES